MYDSFGQRKYLNSDERQRFLKVVRNEKNIQKRTFALTLFFTGCRISEALNLSWDRIDFSEKLVVIETLKQRKSGVFRAISLPEDLVQQLSKLDQHGSIWSFSRTTGWREIKRYMKLAEIEGKKATPKGLRHSFAVAYIENEVPITVVQKWLGHKRLETTSIYLNTVGKEERVLASRIWN